MHFTSLALFLSAPLAVLATPVPANDIVIAKTDNTVVDQPLLQGAAPSANTKRDVDALVPDDFIDAEAPEHEAHRLVARAPSYQSLVLTHHNVHRSNHSASAMGSNYAMAVYAYQWASQCNFAHNTSIGGGGYGQNLYAGTNSVTDAITSAWYNGEVNNFKSTYYGQATPDLSNFGGYGHFTQVVWKGSTSVGCWTFDCSSKGGLKGVGSNVPPYYTVCNYYPAGNYLGEFGTNVGKSLNQKMVTTSYGQ